MILGFFGSVYLTWVFITWLPGYLEIERHMTTINTGFAGGIPFGCGFVGCLVAGWFSDHLIRRGMSPIQSRKLPIVLGMVGMSLFTVPAALGAVQNFGGYLGGALAPILTGSLAQATHSFVPALLIGAVIAFVSAMIYLFGVRDPIS